MRKVRRLARKLADDLLLDLLKVILGAGLLALWGVVRALIGGQ